MKNHDHIINDFPELFIDMRRSYFETDNGWNSIIYDLCKEIKEVVKDKATFKFIQIKEKFGGLRVYFALNPAEDVDSKIIYSTIEALVTKAEERAKRTCEITGKEGFPHHKGGWSRVLCPEEALRLGYQKYD